jgi:putative redox protein
MDSGTSALELSVAALAGCVVTIFLLIARRRGVPIEAASIRLRAERPDGSRTIRSVGGTLSVRSSASASDLSTALRLTLRTCPVGVLFDQAGVPVSVELCRLDAAKAVPEGDPSREPATCPVEETP